MKKMSFFALVAAGLLFSACSSEDVNGGKLPGQEEGAKYIAIGINLPTVPITRATDNGGSVSLEDGLEKEYAVKDVTLLIFGSDEKFKRAYDLTNHNWNMNNDDSHVTQTSKKIVLKVENGVTTGDQLLVVLNRNKLISVENNVLKVNGTEFSGSFDDFQKTIAVTSELGASNMTETGFYMANAPLVDKQGSTTSSLTGATVRTLVPITQVYETPDAAENATADQIYVERGMAKVTLNNSGKTGNLSEDTNIGKLVYSIVGWTLDNTNTKSYLVRSTDKHDAFIQLKSAVNNNVYRYAGNTAITAGEPAYKYRTYFAVDPNYDKDVTDGELKTATIDDYKTDWGDEYPQYCYENTFDVEHQKENQTTLARIKVQVKKDGSEKAENLYTLNGNKSVLYDNNQVRTMIQNEAATFMPSTNATNINVTIPDEAGIVNFSVDGLSDENLAKVKESLGEFVCYQDGISYYTIRIKHFGSGDGTSTCLTPWNINESPTPSAGGIDNIYPTGTNRDNNYLGRYGVLRNNWYDIKINNIKSLGDAEPKEPTDDPDDKIEKEEEPDSYITFQINILSWAKRTQNWEL